MITLESRYRGALLGLAAGDAVGAAVEFKPRGTFTPLTDMIGGGPWDLEPGQWTDDTSMALCLAESLIQCRGFEPADQMRRFVRWWKEGHWSSKGYCFDIGGTTRAALGRFRRAPDETPWCGSTDPSMAGNGSIMRLAPVVLAFGFDKSRAMEFAAQSSRTTHGAPEAVEACALLAALMVDALQGAPREAILTGTPDSSFRTPAIAALARGAYRSKARHEIHGSGYVVQSLEAALWCFDQTHSYRDAVLLAANLGDDADTTAAVVGQFAGAFYGEQAIPETWLAKLTLRAEITRMSDDLLALARESGG